MGLLMLWHDRAPAVAGVGFRSCRLALYPRECQPLKRVPRGCTRGYARLSHDVRHASAGAAAAAAARPRASEPWRGPRALVADRIEVLPALARLRADVGVELAGPAWELARQRARARPVFGPEADVLFFTADTLEQAGRPALAARRAARLLADGDGLGGRPRLRGRHGHDGARPRGRAGGRRRPRPGRPRADPANTAALGLAATCWSSPTTPSNWWQRRAAARSPGATPPSSTRPVAAGGRRLLDPDRWSPPWSTVTALLDRVPRGRGEGGARARPRPGARGHRGGVGLAGRVHRRGGAVGPGPVRDLAPGDARARRTTSWSSPPTPTPGRPRPARCAAGCTSPIPALIRSGLMSLVAADLDATLIDPTIAYLSSDGPRRLPWVSSYRVADVLPFNLKKLKALLGAAASAGSWSRSGAHRSSRRRWPGS